MNIVDVTLAFDAVNFSLRRPGFQPAADQVRVLDIAIRRGLFNCSRQWGKSTVTSIRGIYHAYHFPESTTLVLAPTEGQSAELVRKCRQWLTRLDIKPRSDGANRTSLLRTNGARIVGLPGGEGSPPQLVQRLVPPRRRGHPRPG